MTETTITKEQRMAWREWHPVEQDDYESMSYQYQAYAELLHDRLCQALDALASHEAQMTTLIKERDAAVADRNCLAGVLAEEGRILDGSGKHIHAWLNYAAAQRKAGAE